MSIKRIFAILFIYSCTAVAWFILGGALDMRTSASNASGALVEGWGPPMTQQHPFAYFQSPGTRDGRKAIRPESSRIDVSLDYKPKRRGLLWYRTYFADVRADYVFKNPAPIPQTVFVQFSLPAPNASYNEFSFKLNGKPTTVNVNGREPVVEAVQLEPGAEAHLVVCYKTQGLDRWGYSFGEDSRVQNFLLTMKTNFHEINFPAGTGSAGEPRVREGEGYLLNWSYPDEIGARAIGMDMPNVLNPGPTAARITFFAPVSLLFFFSVLILICLLQKVDLHPMNFFFLGAGCFAFQLLFAYLVDLISIEVAFVVASAVSLGLVSGYLLLARGFRFARLAALAQFSYMVLFSYSFFFDGISGLSIAIGAIATLAILMAATARVNWTEKFARQPAVH